MQLLCTTLSGVFFASGETAPENFFYSFLYKCTIWSVREFSVFVFSTLCRIDFVLHQTTSGIIRVFSFVLDNSSNGSLIPRRLKPKAPIP